MIYVTLGLTCLTIGMTTKFVPEQATVIKVFFLLGKFLASIAETLVFLLLAESFPAECRLLGKILQFLFICYSSSRWHAFPTNMPLQPGVDIFPDTEWNRPA